MQKIKKYWLILAILMLLSMVFYWFEWRPTKIRKDCFRKVADYQETHYPKGSWEKLLKQCITARGLSN